MECKEWKYRRDTYYALNGNNFTDKLEDNDIPIIERFDVSSIVDDAINYVLIHKEEMCYPGKSYMIAIQYASWIEDHFGDDMLETLDDPELLPDDPYFKTYSQNPSVYDLILEYIDANLDYIDTSGTLPYLEMTYKYFLQEFMLDDAGRAMLPRYT